MHNWEYYRRLPAYFLMATLVASCGGGGGSDILSLNGQSAAEITAPTKTIAGLTTSTSVAIQLKENGLPLASQAITLNISGTAKLSKTSVVTDANGIALFSLIGNNVVEKGTITTTYTDSSSNITRQTIGYEVVDGSSKVSAYTIEPVTTDNIVIPTSGQTLTTFSMVLKDASGLPAPKDQVVEFTLASNVASVGRLGAASAKTDATGKVSVTVDGLNQTAGNNFLIATYTDSIGSKAVVNIPFQIVSQFEVLLTAPSNELRTGGDFVALTATVFNASQALVKNAKVSFQILANEPLDGGSVGCSQNLADPAQFKQVALSKFLRGTLSKNDILTDENGQATTTFNVNDNHNGNRRVIVTVDDNALVDKPLDCLDFNISGTKISVDPTQFNTSAGQSNQITAIVKNGRGLGIKGALIEFSGAGLTPQTVTTGDAGTVSLGGLTFVNDGVITAKNTDLALAAESKVAVSEAGQRVFFVDGAGTEVTEGAIGSSGVFVKLQAKASTKQPRFATTLGTVTEPYLDNDLSDGFAQAQLSSDRPGLARVDVLTSDGTTHKVIGHGEFRFISTIPNKINLQSDQVTLKPKGQALIEAEVLDVNDNPVKGALVEFHRDKDQSNGSLSAALVTTDANGVATVSFTAGETDTAKDAVEISAVIRADANHPQVNPAKNVLLTVGGQALFISIAAGRSLLVVDSTTYALPLSVAVTDAVGHPVADKNISIQVIPTRFFKGQYLFSTVRGWFTVGRNVEDGLFSTDPVACPNEDINGNGILDSNEDTNKDGSLSPGNPVTIVGNLITNDAGRSSFEIQYGKSYANWLEVKVIASTEVSGSESKAERVFTLPVLGADITDGTTMPPGGITSEYGLPTTIVLQNSFGISTGVISSYTGTELMTTLEDITPKLYSPISSCTTKKFEAPVYYLKR